MNPVSAQVSSQIGIVDLNMGNIASLKNAIDYCGFDVRVINWQADKGLLIDENPCNVDDCHELTHLIIPGVGQFKAAIDGLKASPLLTLLQQWNNKQKPLMGICLGMQLLACRGEEGEGAPGLSFIKGAVSQLKGAPRLPHIGWNQVQFNQAHNLLSGIKDLCDFYFVHSFAFNPMNQNVVIGKTEYGTFFPSIIVQNQIIGLQFHPEKSQRNGLQLLENFCNWQI